MGWRYRRYANKQSIKEIFIGIISSALGLFLQDYGSKRVVDDFFNNPFTATSNYNLFLYGGYILIGIGAFLIIRAVWRWLNLR